MASEAKLVFLVLSESDLDGEELQKELRNNEAIEVENVQSFREVVERMMAGEVNCLVFNMGTFNLNAVQVINKLQSIRPALSTLVTSEHIAKEAVKAARRMKRVVVMERPLDDLQLNRLVEKIKSGTEIYQRAHERFATNQEADVVTLEGDKTFKVRLHNISQGGAYLELPDFFKVGSIFKLTVPLDKLSKAHVVYAQVVRLILDGFGKGKHAAGVRFIEESEAMAEIAKQAEEEA